MVEGLSAEQDFVCYPIIPKALSLPTWPGSFCFMFYRAVYRYNMYKFQSLLITSLFIQMGKFLKRYKIDIRSGFLWTLQ